MHGPQIAAPDNGLLRLSSGLERLIPAHRYVGIYLAVHLVYAVQVGLYCLNGGDILLFDETGKLGG